ncbi:unnamed protein product [Malus baccata var. baccata]
MFPQNCKDVVPNHDSKPSPTSDAVKTLENITTQLDSDVSDKGGYWKELPDELSEQKRLYNEVIELKGNIRVFCRFRPLNQTEISSGSGSVVGLESSLDSGLQVICSDSSKKQFKFDHVFGPEGNQEAVFAQTKPIVSSVLDGYNVCIFAYGQTGTGKTFTMEGTPKNRGVNFRRYELCVSMLEVNNEKTRDILVDNTNQPTKK